MNMNRRKMLTGVAMAGVGAVAGIPLAKAAPHSEAPMGTAHTIVELYMDWDAAEGLGYGKARYGDFSAVRTGRGQTRLGFLNDVHKFEHVRGNSDAGPKVVFEVVGFRQVRDMLLKRGVRKSSLYLLGELTGNGTSVPETPTTVKAVRTGYRSAPVMLDNGRPYFSFQASYTVYEAPVFVSKLRVGSRMLRYPGYGDISFMQFCNVQYGGLDFENLYL